MGEFHAMIAGQTRKYRILVRILDEYVKEGQSVRKRRRFFLTDTVEHENQARSRAFIHLYLAAKYGLIDFEDREHFITDDNHDGGVDAYYINTNDKVIDIIQAKFRPNPVNFEEKFITPEELMSIDIDRILSGHRDNIKGQRYNGYILSLIDKVSSISDIARYTTRVTILANVKVDQEPLVNRLFPGDETDIVNFERCYVELVLPTLRGEQHYTDSMRLQVDLSNKSNASRLSAEIITSHGPSEVTVVLVPTLEIAQLMSRYKNSILRYNPRSYLEFREQRTNEGIKNSIVGIETGEFAILNNGITVVSDETFVNERIGAKNKAQIEIVNPQIINGGQTAFTLSRIYDEASDIERAALFEGKEVVMRIITLPQIDEASKKELILSISSATNSQTTVSAIDRTASNDTNRAIAEAVFLRTGLLYEPKKGEYADAVHQKYVSKSDIIERSLFTRIMLIAQGKYALALQRRVMRVTGGIVPDLKSNEIIDKFVKMYEIYNEISDGNTGTPATATIAHDLSLTMVAYEIMEHESNKGCPVSIKDAIRSGKDANRELELWARNQDITEFKKRKVNKQTGEEYEEFARMNWKKSARYPNDIKRFVTTLRPG